jgi:hypothetical protein
MAAAEMRLQAECRVPGGAHGLDDEASICTFG